MNHSLLNLESWLEEQVQLAGEELLEQGQPEKMAEVERHLWSARVAGQEVEIHVSPSRIKGFSCDCTSFRADRICSHVAAGLLALRRQLLATKENRPPRLPLATGRRRLTHTALLDSVTPDELKVFVRQYAKMNKAFSLALKSRFASKVSAANAAEKYGQVLEDVIRHGRGNKDRISKAGRLLLEKTVRELAAQAEENLALHQPGEAWAISSALLEKVLPVLRKMPEENALENLLRNNLQRIEQICRMPVPPALKEDICRFCATHFARPAFRLNGYTAPLLRLLLSLHETLEDDLELLLLLQAELDKPGGLPAAHAHPLQAAKIQLLHKPGLEAAAEAFTLECLSEPPLLKQTLEAAASAGLLPLVKPLIEKARRLLTDPALQLQLDEMLLKIARQENNGDVIFKMARCKFLETGQLEYYEAAKASHKGPWKRQVQQIIGELVSRADYRRQIPVIAGVLEREGMDDDLLRLLSNEKSLDLLLKFDAILLKKQPEAALRLYQDLISAYLSDHLGLKAAEKIQSALHHLQIRQAEPLADRLTVFIRQAFPTRTFLFEDLEVL